MQYRRTRGKSDIGVFFKVTVSLIAFRHQQLESCNMTHIATINIVIQFKGTCNENDREEVKTVRSDILSCDLCDQGQRCEPRSDEGISILGHLQSSQPVLHRAHPAQIRSSPV